MGKYLDIADTVVKETITPMTDFVVGPISNSDSNKHLTPLLQSESSGSECHGIPFSVNSKLLHSLDELHAWVEGVLDNQLLEVLTVDIETTGLSFTRDRICGIALEANNNTIYIPIGHEDAFSNLPTEEVKLKLAPLFSSTTPKLFHNATFDLPFLILSGFKINGPYVDTRLMAKEVHRREQRSYGLKDLACHHIHPRSNYWDEELALVLKSRFRSTKKENLWRLAPNESYPYATADVFLTRKLYELFQSKIKDSSVSQQYVSVEHEMISLVTNLIKSGLKINEPGLRSHIEKMKVRILEIDTELDQAFFTLNVNYNSAKQVLPLLQAQNLNPINPSTGKQSICIDALKGLKKPSPAVKILMEQVKLRNQLKQISGVPELVKNGRIHSQLTISAQLGERFSSTNPSLYIGKKRPEAGEMTSRQFIEPDDDYVLVFCDYSASHFRILAHLCDDANMISLFQSGRDFHKGVASLMFNKKYDAVSKEDRERAKPIGFSVIYGAGYNSLAQNLNIKPSEAKRLKDQFLYKIFPKLGPYLQEIYRAVTIQGYVISGIHGVKIVIPKEHAYKGINYQIQVTEAEILKKSLLEANKLLLSHKSRIALPFHDEIVFQIHKKEFYLIPIIKSIVEDHKLRVPIVCDVEIAERCWAEKKPWCNEGVQK